MDNNREVLLKVSNLCQYFKLGGKDLKAVDNISFEVKKGEVLGIVGESGCGKTTAGRSIIKLYDATSGDVYFKGQRIVAGTRSYYNTIKQSRLKAKKEIAELNDELKAKITAETDQNIRTQLNEEYKNKVFEIRSNLHAVVSEQKANIAAAKFDHKKGEKVYQQNNIQAVKEKYLPLIQAETDPAKRNELNRKFKDAKRIAGKERVVTEIQMIFQDPIASLDPRMTVREIIAEGLVIKGVKDKDVIDEEVNKMLEMVGLVSDHANRYPHEFSGGQRQRIGVARSIIMKPSLIIADEPVSALDVSIQAQIINLLNDLREKLGLTIIFIAHDLSVIKYFSDRVAVMYYGKIVEMAEANELFKNPIHPYTKSLLSAIPLPDPMYEKNRKRIIYNPIVDHDYSQEKPILRELNSNHIVLCNSVEFEKYKKEIKA